MMVNQSEFYNVNKNVQFSKITLLRNPPSGNVNTVSIYPFNHLWIVRKYRINRSNNFYYILCLSFISGHICGSDIEKRKSDIK